MAVEVEIDVQVLKSEIKKTYASVSQEQHKDFIFPTGRPWAEDLGYPTELANVPDTAVGSFAGVANPWQLGRLAPGERVLDLGSGAGTDSLVAAQMVGEQGHVTGIDMTPEMLATARAAAAEMGAINVEFVEAEAEQLPSPARRSSAPAAPRSKPTSRSGSGCSGATRMGSKRRRSLRWLRASACSKSAAVREG
jgi:arsenite methyltransferase